MERASERGGSGVAARWGMRVGVLLGCGVVATYFVAWLGVMWSPKVPEVIFARYGPMPNSVEIDGVKYRASDWMNVGIRDERWSVHSEWNPDGRLGSGRQETKTIVQEVRSGWPLRSLSVTASMEEDRDDDVITVFAGKNNGWDTAKLQKQIGINRISTLMASARPHVLPKQLIWLGFPVSVAFWSCAIGLLFYAPRAFRRVLRRHRGLCVQCAYEVRGVSICPECGTAVRGNDAERVAQGVVA